MSTQGEYEFEGVKYTYDGLLEMSVLDQKELFNEISDQLGLTHVPRFTDRQNGAVRLWARLKEYDSRLTKWPDDVATGSSWTPPPREEEETPVAANETAAPPAEEVAVPTTPATSSIPTSRRKRQKYFNFPALEVIKQPRTGTLRDRVLSQLTVKGLTFDEVVVMVRDFDTDRQAVGKDLHGSDEHAERRAYEILRIIHYVLGYGMRQDEATGLITVFTENKRR